MSELNNIILIFVTILFSAFFSGMEIAFVSSNKILLELDKKKNRLSSMILSLFYRNREQFISTMLVGNNISLVIYGIAMARLMEYPLSLIWQNSGFILLSQTLISTFIILVTAEFLPKILFRLKSNFALRIFVYPLYIIYLVLYPISKFSSVLSKGILWLLGVKLSKETKSSLVSKVDLDFFIKQRMDDVPENKEMESEVKIFQNALDFSNVRIRDCMIPRTEVVSVDVNEADRKDLISKFIKTGLSKIIVYKDQIDDVIGYIHSSEMFKCEGDWKKGIHPISIVPETMSAQKLMKLLMLQKRSIAVVVDEFGGTAGIVTLEDLVEEIFGDIEDEHDNRQYIARKIGENEYELSGRLEIEQANELFDLDFPESDDYQTVAGFILYHYQTLPQLNEVIEIGIYTFRILKITTTKIELVRMKMEKK